LARAWVMAIRLMLTLLVVVEVRYAAGRKEQVG
jgi:hypothetical protein